jgi:hypothetical protein
MFYKLTYCSWQLTQFLMLSFSGMFVLWKILNDSLTFNKHINSIKHKTWMQKTMKKDACRRERNLDWNNWGVGWADRDKSDVLRWNNTNIMPVAWISLCHCYAPSRTIITATCLYLQSALCHQVLQKLCTVLCCVSLWLVWDTV